MSIPGSGRLGPSWAGGYHQRVQAQRISVGAPRHRWLRRRIGLAVGLVGCLGLISASARALVVRDPLPARADAIVVIGGDHKPERVALAVDLYRRGIAPVVLISAGVDVLEGGRTVREAEVMINQAEALGLPREVIVVEDWSQTTVGNATETLGIARRLGWHSIVLVTSSYHSRRAGGLFHTYLDGEVSVSVQPAPQAGCPPCWALSPADLATVLYEYRNLLWSGLTVSSDQDQP